MDKIIEASRDKIMDILDTIVSEAKMAKEMTIAMRDIVWLCDSADEYDWKKIIDQIHQIADAY